MKTILAENEGKPVTRGEWLWLRKLAYHVAWQEKEWAEYPAREAARWAAYYADQGASDEPDEDDDPPQMDDPAPPREPHTCQIKWINEHGETPDNNPPIGRVRCKLYRWRMGVRQPDFDWSQWYNICADHAMRLADPDRADWEFEPLPDVEAQS